MLLSEARNSHLRAELDSEYYAVPFFAALVYIC
jgi:hypothetical protein